MKLQRVALLFVLGAMSASAAQVSVSMVDFAFSPDSVNIGTGDQIQWTNNSGIVHTSTSGLNGVPDGQWNSGNVSPGSTYNHTFASAGTFHYYCMYHYTMGMVGVVVVGGSGMNDTRASIENSSNIRSYPNPFRTMTTLRVPFVLGARRRPTALRIFNVAGHLVRTLVLSPAPGLALSASYVRWDGRADDGKTVPAGVYRCLSPAGSAVLTKVN